ncbi:MAG TPA: hypothetical protein DCX07_12715 [Phycisphaerales bacterium]|nr:hypothetical protein [Phycisphaerales bacterium]
MAKRKEHSELAAGLFVLVALGATVGVVLWLGAAEWFARGAVATFYAEEKDGNCGLDIGSFVYVGGKEVGKIAEIRFDAKAGRTLYLARIETDGLDLRSDGKAHAAAALVGGANLVVTSRGTPGKPPADLEHPMPVTGGLDRAMTDLSAAAENVRRVSELVRAELDTQQGGEMLGKVRAIVGDLQTAARDVSQAAANVLAQTRLEEKDSLLAKIHRTADDVNAMSADARPKMERTMTAVADTAEKIQQYADKDIADLLARLRESNTEILKVARDLSEVSDTTRKIVTLNRDNIDRMLDNMRLVSEDLKAASREIRRNPWRLLYKPKPDEIATQNVYDAARAFANGATQLDMAIAKLNALSEANPQGLPANDPQLQQIREDIQKTFANFKKVEDILWKEASQ